MTANESLPFPQHRTCATLTRLTLEHLPPDGSLGRARTFPKDSDIWQADDQADRLYFLKRGDVAILSGDPQARDILLQTIAPGEPFGELCLCAEGAGLRNTVARAHTAVTAVEVEFQVFLDYMRRSEATHTSLVCTFCLRLTDCETRSQILAYRGAQERLGQLLLQLARKGMERHARSPTLKPTAGAVVLRVSHQQLARMAAMSRPHVTVTLGHFRDRALVQYSRTEPLSVNAPALSSYLAARTSR